jgi:hypothetical protein
MITETLTEMDKVKREVFPQRWYLIFVRPPGSKVWTQHQKKVDSGHWIPWTHSNPLKAAEEARMIFMNSGWSVNVIDIDHDPKVHEEAELSFSEETFEQVVTMENEKLNS